MGSFRGFSHQVFQLGKDLLDRVQIGRIWRQEKELGASGSDSASDGGLFVAGQIVHDDDVAGRQGRHEALLDIVGEALGVDRLVEHAGRVDPVATQGREEGHGPPVAVGRLGMEPLPDRRPAPERGHVRLHPGFVDEDEARRIKPALILLPLCPAPRDRGSELFGGQNAFF
jgi:hypothetical protein